MNTPTPETDAKQKLKDMIGDEYVSTDFARRLERERDEWKAKYIKQNKDLGCEMMDPNGTIWDYAKKLERERNGARKQLNVWKNEAEVVRVELKKADEALENNIATFLDLREQLSVERTLANRLAKALRELRDAEWLTLPGRANDIVEAALATLNQRLAHAPRRRENPNEENDFMTTENTDTPLKAGYPSATCSPLDFAVLAGIRAAAKAGITPIALAVHRRDADKDALGGLPVMSAGTLQFDDWGTGCKYLPLFGSNNVATLEAERAFMEAVSLSHPRRAWKEARDGSR